MDKETWKVIPNTDGRYEVSDCGRVRTNRRRGGLLTLTKQASGYLYVMIEFNNGKPKNCRVNRLVAQAFIDNPDCLPVVNHIDGNKENNHVTNLEWTSHSDNMKHAIRTGLADPKKHAHHWTIEERKQISARRIEYLERMGSRAKPRRTWNEYLEWRRMKAEESKKQKAQQPRRPRGRPRKFPRP